MAVVNLGRHCLFTEAKQPAEKRSFKKYGHLKKNGRITAPTKQNVALYLVHRIPYNINMFLAPI